MNHSHFVERNVTSELHRASPMREVRLVDDHPCYGSCDPSGTCYGRCKRDVHHEDQDFGDAAKEKLYNAGRAIKRTAESIGDKAGDLKDKAKEKIQDGVEAIKGN